MAYNGRPPGLYEPDVSDSNFSPEFGRVVDDTQPETISLDVTVSLARRTWMQTGPVLRQESQLIVGHRSPTTRDERVVSIWLRSIVLREVGQVQILPVYQRRETGREAAVVDTEIVRRLDEDENTGK